MIIVHHLNNSRSQRILWLLEELNLAYEIKRYERNKVTMLAPPELKEIHPLGKSPVIQDGSLIIAESGAIIEYLVNKYGQALKPTEEKDLINYTYWLHYAEGSLMPILLVALVAHKIATAPMPFFVKPIAKKISDSIKGMLVTPQLKTHLDFLEDNLSKHEWFAGKEFTAADIQMSFPIEAAASRGGLNNRPKLQNYLNKIYSRSAYKAALERGGAFSIPK